MQSSTRTKNIFQTEKDIIDATTLKSLKWSFEVDLLSSDNLKKISDFILTQSRLEKDIIDSTTLKSLKWTFEVDLLSRDVLEKMYEFFLSQ